MLSIFKIKIDKEYINLVNDIIKIVCSLTILNLLLFISKTNASFFNRIYFELMLFLIVSVCLYWLVIKKVFVFVPTEE